MKNLRVAVAQMDCILGDKDKNLETIERLARTVARRSPDLVCFPELATTGYSLNERWDDLAERIPGKSSDFLSDIARKFNFALVCGIVERDSEKHNRIYDSAVIYDRNGMLIGSYRKVHLWAEERKYFTPGNSFTVFKTDKFHTIGVGICYDLEFPESSRSMALQGAQLVLFPSAEMKPMENHIETYLKSRSAENCIFTAFSNRIGKEGKTVFFGQSQIVSPSCKALAKVAKKAEGFAVADLDFSLLEKERCSTLPYLSQRVPSAYCLSQSEENE